ncbi:hypothetical protein BUUB107078_10620 [Burkholderia ubonensis]|nr:hypothetical protein BUB20358_00949 [Burkholderia ubonensis]
MPLANLTLPQQWDQSAAYEKVITVFWYPNECHEKLAGKQWRG